MSTDNARQRTLFDELKLGDRIEVERTETDGRESRTIRTTGKVLRIEHVHRGLPPRNNHVQTSAKDAILLELPDGELTSVAMDESTVLRRA